MPVTPDSLTVKVKGRSKKVELMSGGEIVIPKDPSLTEIETTVLLPISQKPQDYLELFKELLLSKAPFKFMLVRIMPDGKKALFDTNMNVILEEYKIKEDAEDGLDLTVELSMKEYRKYSTHTYKVSNGKAIKIS